MFQEWSPMSFADSMPDPTDRSRAWHEGKPAYLVWWEAAQNGATAAYGDPYSDIDIHVLCRSYSYAIPTNEAIDFLLSLSPVVEIGAGTGYWARLLRDKGGDVVAYDQVPAAENTWTEKLEPWTDVRIGDEVAIERHADRVCFVSWPPRPGSFLDGSLARKSCRRLALITDGRASASTDRLYDALESNYVLETEIELPTWPYRNDRLMYWIALPDEL
jgi:hypothetical protein